MHLCVRSINFPSVYDFSIGFSKCSDSALLFVFHLIDKVNISAAAEANSV